MAETFPVRCILFPTDFSEASRAVASHATGLAKITGAKIRILNIIPWLTGWHGVAETYFGPADEGALLRMEAARREMERASLKALEAFREKHFADAVESEVRAGSGGVAEAIVDTAVEAQADLIMLPTRGAGSWRRFLIGSTTAKVLHDSLCPVWTTPHAMELRPFHPYRNILVAMDYAAPSKSLLRCAAEFAEWFHSALHLVSVIPVPARAEAPAVDRESVIAIKRSTGARLHELVEEEKTKASVAVLEGCVGDRIQEIAHLESSDLIVTGRSHFDGLAGHEPSLGYQTIALAPCPVLSFKLASTLTGGKSWR